MFNVDRKRLAIRLCAVMVLVVGAGLVSTKMWPQAQSEYASILGVVTDPSGAVIPNATVTLTSPALQVAQVTTKTDAGGNYRFVTLPAPGIYRLTFAATGFRTVVRPGITLTVGFTARVDTRMSVGNTTAEVVVTGAGPVINTVSTAVTSTLQYETLSKVPVPLGMQDILSLAAGVSLAGGSGRWRQQPGRRPTRPRWRASALPAAPTILFSLRCDSRESTPSPSTKETTASTSTLWRSPRRRLRPAAITPRLVSPALRRKL